MMRSQEVPGSGTTSKEGWREEAAEGFRVPKCS